MGISTLSLLICLARMVLHYYDATMMWIEVGYSAILGTLWCYSVQSQTSGDFSDPSHPSIRPWYLERGCHGIKGTFHDACVFGQASFALAYISM